MERILKDMYQDYFKIGVACEKINGRFTNHEIGNPAKEALMIKHFNSMTLANELKPAYNMGFDSAEARTDYLPFVINPRAKEMLDWARDNGLAVRGHVLLWHSQCPREIFCVDYKPVTIPTDPEILKNNPMMKMFERLDPVCFVDRDTLLVRLKTYIYSVMEYMYSEGYMNTIYAWDVVNEAIELDDHQPTGLRNSYWYQIIGDDFIYWAFRYAYDAVEEISAKYETKYGKIVKPVLFYNDYNEFHPDKKDAILAMLNREGNGHGSIVSEKLISGIGMQGHLSDNNDCEEYAQAIRDYAKLGVEIHVTELDVKCTCTNKNAEYYQAVFYKNFFEMLLREKKAGANITSVTFWGLTDDNSWIHGADPLLFRGDLSEKKSFDAVVYALTGESLGEPEIIKAIPAEELGVLKESFENGFNHIGRVRGFGHFPFIMVTDKESRDNASHSLFVTRHEKESTVKFNIINYVGHKVRFTAYVKAVDSVVRFGLDGAKPLQMGEIQVVKNEWNKISGEVALSTDMLNAEIYVETDGTGDFYVDDITVEICD